MNSYDLFDMVTFQDNPLTISGSYIILCCSISVLGQDMYPWNLLDTGSGTACAPFADVAVVVKRHGCRTGMHTNTHTHALGSPHQELVSTT